MELFLSYSRRDSVMSDRLRADLEAAGHSVWLDRDGIRGGEQWRASLVNAITNADRVILLMSPHSMESENVARELTVAEDLGKPIIPIVLETSVVPPEFQYLLAGVQYITFEGRLYGVALDELLEDLNAPDPGRTSAKMPSVSGSAGVPASTRASTTGPAGGARRRMKWVGWGVVVIVLFIGGLINLVDGLSTDTETSTSRLDGGVAAAGATSTSPELRTMDLGGSAWLAGVHFFPTEAIQDPTSELVTVKYQVAVEQTEPTDFLTLQGSMFMELADGAQLDVWGNSGDVPGLGRSSVDFTYCCTPASTDLTGATLLFGKPTEQRWTLPMGPDTQGVGPEPIQMETTGRVDAEGLYYEIGRIDVVPWACSWVDDGYPEYRGRTSFGPVSDDRYSVLMTGTLGSDTSPAGGNSVGGDASVRQPNGNQAPSVGFYTLYDSGDHATQVPLCFLVDSPPEGSYVLNWSSVQGGADSFEFEVP